MLLFRTIDRSRDLFFAHERGYVGARHRKPNPLRHPLSVKLPMEIFTSPAASSSRSTQYDVHQVGTPRSQVSS